MTIFEKPPHYARVNQETLGAFMPRLRLMWRVLGLTLGLLLLSKLLQPWASFDLFQRQGIDSDNDSIGTVKWWDCQGPRDAPGAECGYIIVPQDYLNSSAGVAKVALGRYNATSKPKKGMVLFNPGGPGGPGKPVATILGPSMQHVISTHYDFVGFDPRGIGEAQPQVNCFGTPLNAQLFKANTVLERGFDVGPNLTDSRTRERLIVQQIEADSLYKTQFELCGKSMGDSLKYMGTSTVNRDIDFITTALEGKDALINFYGASYGSILGMYLVNMFPNRVGKVVIDGIVDAVAWSSIPYYKWYRTWLGNTEDVYKLFLNQCSKAGPTVCPLAESKDEDPARIEIRIEDFFAEIYTKPLTVPFAKRPATLTSGRARIFLFGALGSPRSWPATALALYQAMQGDGLSLLNSVLQGHARDLERSAVSCNDNAPFSAPSAEEVINESLEVLKTVTRFGLSVVTTEPDAGCQFWPVTPSERFHGPWNHTLRNPILIHSNTMDPATPLSSGRLANQLLGNSSRLAIKDGPGHTSFALTSLCTIRITQNYFNNGTLPPDGDICSVDESPFPSTNSSQAPIIEESTMLEHIRMVGEAMDRLHQGLDF